MVPPGGDCLADHFIDIVEPECKKSTGRVIFFPWSGVPKLVLTAGQRHHFFVDLCTYALLVLVELCVKAGLKSSASKTWRFSISDSAPPSELLAAVCNKNLERHPSARSSIVAKEKP